MKKTVYTVKHLNCPATRTSHRAYTHVVFGSNAISDETIHRIATKDALFCKANFDYWRELVKLGVGGIYRGSSISWPVEQREYDDAKSKLDACGNDYATYAASVYEAVTKREQERRASEQGVVLQWSMSERAARAAIGTWQKRGYACRVEKTDQAI